jgi:hypothetical protein
MPVSRMAGTKSTDGDGNDASGPRGAERGKTARGETERQRSAADERAERLAAALRANLGRRKAAARADTALSATKDVPDEDKRR